MTAAYRTLQQVIAYHSCTSTSTTVTAAAADDQAHTSRPAAHLTDFGCDWQNANVYAIIIAVMSTTAS